MSPAVSNTSPLTNLAVIGRLDLVKEQLYHEGLAPLALLRVADEPASPAKNS